MDFVLLGFGLRFSDCISSTNSYSSVDEDPLVILSLSCSSSDVSLPISLAELASESASYVSSDFYKDG